MSPIHLATAAVLSAALLFTTAHESAARGGKMGMGRTNALITQTQGGSGANKPIVRDHRKCGGLGGVSLFNCQHGHPPIGYQSPKSRPR